MRRAQQLADASLGMALLQTSKESNPRGKVATLMPVNVTVG
jgi:hypothetical protein